MKSDAQLAKELYNRQAEDFSKKQTACPINQELKKHLYTRYLSQIASKKILFAGCGDGRECLEAVAQRADVVGIDISEKLIALAKAHCPNADFFVMDMEHLTFEKSSFDAVVCVLAVMYKENLRAVLSDWKRLLKQEGSIILAVPHPVRKMMKYNGQNYFVKGKQLEVWEGIERFGYYRLFEDYVEAAVGAGLKIVDCSEPQLQSDPIAYPYYLVMKFVRD